MNQAFSSGMQLGPHIILASSSLSKTAFINNSELEDGFLLLGLVLLMNR